MEEVLACRVCLSTDIKLFNLFQYKLAEPFEILTGIQITECDTLPHQICSYCSALLLKSVSFKEKCCNSQDFLKYSLVEQRELSADYLQSVRRELNLALPYTTVTNVVTIGESHSVPIKVEEIIETEVPMEDLMKMEVIADESMRKLKKPYRRGKNIKEEAEELQIITVKLEKDNETLEYDNDDIDYTPPSGDSDSQEDVEELKDMDLIILTKAQQIQEIEARQTSFNYLNSFYKCDKCYKGFITDSTFKNHMKRHDPKSGDYECDVCRARWPEARSLRAHVVTSHERKYVCRLCSHVSRSSNRAKEHINWHTGYTFVCKICGASFAKSTSHLTHIRLQHPSNNCCEVCGESFIGEYGLRMHKRRAHKDLENGETKVLLQCANCASQFTNYDALQKHLEDSKGNICDPGVKSCSQCGEGFPSDDELRDHMKEHQKDDPVHCQDCDRTFANARSHSVHYQRVHLGVKLKQRRASAGAGSAASAGVKRPSDSVVCEVCGRKCISKATLMYHQRTHTGEKPFQCSHCPKKFSVLQRLQIHIRTHTGESPYKCAHCPKAFKHKAALNRHDRVHTGVKPYSCPHCGKCFSQSNSMKLHVNTVHLKMPAPYRNRKSKTSC